MVKDLPDESGEEVSIPALGRFPWRREWQPTPVFLPRKSHRQRNLWSIVYGVSKSQTGLSAHTHTHTNTYTFVST